jgi:hypothetical protein
MILLVPEFLVGTRMALSRGAFSEPNVATASWQLRMVPPSSS